jgi:alkylation response protein AidB-like acyl-CoA dehydrogenase
MDVRLSPEQRALRDAAAQLVDRLGPGSVADLDDAERAAKLDAAVAAAGWRELRAPAEDGSPFTSAVETALVAEELARGLADVAYVGPVLATELRRLAAAPLALSQETIVLAPGLGALADSLDGAVAFDAAGSSTGLVLLGDGIGQVTLGPMVGGVDLTRREVVLHDAEAESLPGALDPLDLQRWTALGLALSCADLVGTMRGAIALSCDYAKTRRQYGAAIGSFQAIQHLLADAYVAMEGSRSVALHAAWAVDALPAPEALAAASVAKAYCARAARSVGETAVQVHGGIGNTWECLAHVYLRRALVSGDLLGDVAASLARVLAAHEIGAGHGLR